MLKKTAACLLIAYAVFAAAAETPQLPNTAPGRLLGEWQKLFNASDTAGLAKFLGEHYSSRNLGEQRPEMLARRHAQLRNMLGGEITLATIEKSTPNDISAVFRSNAAIPMFVSAHYELDSSGKIDQSRIGPTEAPDNALGPRLSAEELARDLEPRLQKLSQDDQFSGAVLIAKDGRPVWQKAYGLADRDSKTPNTLDTRFRLGSMPKMFTSVAIAQLVQAGKLKYTDTLAQVLPDYPNQEVAQKITVHQLLTHTSGLGDIFTPEFQRTKDSLHDLKDYLPLFVNQPLRFEPGKDWSYSNAGFIVLGLIIEHVSGQNYYDYVQRHIYDVAGMKDTGAFPKTQKVPRLAVGYTRMQSADGKLRDNWETLPWRGMSAGGSDSTVGDMLRFANALRDHKLLNPQLTETVMTGKVHPDRDSPGQYAYGFDVRSAGGHQVVGHGGGAPGMNGQLDIYTDAGYTVVVLANLDPPAAQRVAGYIAARLR